MVGGRRPGASGMVKAIRTIPAAVRDKQASASNPASSAFVSANAGSGKTHVLVQRVIRLLLSGVAPEKILCITFTKAAAANMAERVFTTLGHWVTLDNAALDDAIRDAGISQSRSRSCARSRANCLRRRWKRPGGLKVQTIHALCTRLLQQFPFEANVPARFAVLDDRDQTDMMERANLKVFLEASKRARQRARPRAADRDGERRRRHLQGRRARGLSVPRSFHGLDRCRRQRGSSRGADVGGARRAPRTTASRTSSARSSTGPICRARAGWKSPTRSMPAARQDQNQAEQLRIPLGVDRQRRRWTNISRVFLTD